MSAASTLKPPSAPVRRAWVWLRRWEEGAEGCPKMMTIGLHPRTVGRPGRIGGLDKVLRHMVARGRVWFATREEIARHWLATQQA